MSFPRYTHRQSPQTISVMQQLVGIVAPQGFGASVFAPHPAAQPVSYPVLRLTEHARALPVMEVSTPAPQQLIQFVHGLGYAPMQGPMVEMAAHFISQSLLTFGTRFDVRILPLAQSRALPAHLEAQKVKALAAVHRSGFLFIELKSACFQPPLQTPPQFGRLAGCAQDDKVIGIAYQHRLPSLLG